MPRFVAWVLLLGVAFSASACIVEEPGPGPGHDRWCYNHPDRCR
jgi:hypothetical protein